MSCDTVSRVMAAVLFSVSVSLVYVFPFRFHFTCSVAEDVVIARLTSSLCAISQFFLWAALVVAVAVSDRRSRIFPFSFIFS